MKKFVLLLLVSLAWARSSQAQYTLPFTETFVSSSQLPEEWVSWQSAGQGASWAAVEGMGGTGDGCAFSWYNGTIWLISKAITVPVEGSVDISFYQKDGNPTSSVKHGLYYSITGAQNLAAWTAIYADLGVGDLNWRISPTFTLTGYAGTTLYIAWEYEGSIPGGWYVDNIHMEVTPQCPTPLGVNATGITVSSATLNWTAPSSPPSNGYDIYYSTTSTPPTSSTVPTATVGAGITTYSMVSLSANTVYYAWVRSNCGGSSASWTNVYSFATLCNAVTVLPFNEGFESGYTDQTSVGGCWTQFGGAWGKYWMANSSETTFNRGPRTGNWDATLGMYGDTWMFRKFTLTGGMYYTVSCWAQQNGSTPSYATIELKYGTVDTPGGMTGSIQSPTGLTTSYTQISGSFAPATTGDYYIGIHGWHNSYPHADYITLDDIQVSQTYSCFPPTAVASTAIAQTSANITWTPPASSPASGYDIYYSTSSTAPTTSTTPSGSVAAGVTAYTMTPLTLGTTYYVWVRSNCGSGNLSTWSTVYSFSTHGIVPTGITVPGTYPNLTGVGGAFEAINAGGLNGNTTINITADLTEPGTYALNAWTENPAGSNYTLLIKPDASTLRTISGTLTYSASLPALIRTNGASRFTIDGQAGKYLTFRNTTATPATTAGTIQFNNGSQNCYLKNSTVESNYSAFAYGTVTIGSTGSNSIEISGNDLRDATAGTTGTPGVGIFCNNSLSSLNILNNNIYNFNLIGIYILATANGAVINGNSLYYNSPTAPATGQWGIYLMTATFNHLVTGNYIGGQAPLCQGNAWTCPSGGNFEGIFFGGSGAGTSTFSNNIIRNIAFTNSGASTFYGMRIMSGLVNIMNNTVGSETVAGSISYAGNGILYGLYLTSTNQANTAENNIFGNWSLTSASGTPTVYGMYVYSVNARKNKIFGISASNAALTPVIYGIYTKFQNHIINEFSNNIITLDAGAATDPTIYGFYNDDIDNMNLNLFYNTILISGPPTASSSTYAAYMNKSILDLKNNIFANSRGAGGTGKHFSLFILDSHPLSTTDYNDFYSVAGPLLHFQSADVTTLASWQTVTGQDAHSISTNPLFVSATDLHPQQPLLVAGTTVATVTTDYSGITRATVPTIGAYELTQVVTTAATSVTQTGATLNGTVNACSQNVVTSFEYGLTTSYGSSVAASPSPVTGNTATGIIASLTGLTINSLYHYRAVGTVGASNYYGADFTFDLVPTPVCTSPTAVAATAICQTSASIAWTPPASAPASGYDIYYSTSSTPPTINTTPTASVAAGVTVYTMTPITLGTTYYVWVRSNCGSGDLSMWSTVYSFSTHSPVPTAVTVPGTYPNLTGVGGAFEAINCDGLNGNTTISITTDLTEPGTYALNDWTENPPASNYTLLIKPDASTLRTISGTLSYSASLPALIRTNGASRFTIDGQSGKYLTFRNTTTSPAGTAGTILFNNGSQNCYLKNSTVENNCSPTSYGTVTIGNTGNNSVEISGNDVRDATAGTTGIPGVGIYCASQTSSLSILNNNVYNFNNYGILMITAANGAVISGNSIFYNSPTAPTGSQYGIFLMPSTFNHLVTNNYIGGQAPLCQGNAWTYPGTGTFAGIYASGPYAGLITISNNMIRNIAMTSSGVPAFYGMLTGTGLFSIKNNTVGSESVAGSVTYAGTGEVYGLYLTSSNSSNAVENNIFGNWSLTAATGHPVACGMLVYSVNAVKNKIFNIAASNATLTPKIYGIWGLGANDDVNEYSNNIISLDAGAATNPIIYGFYNEAYYNSALKFYYNDIHISGPPTGSSSTYIIYSCSDRLIEFKNNIFSNLRSPGGTGKHYVLYTCGWTTPLNSDYNDFYTVAGPFIYYDGYDLSNLAAWQSISGQDPHSLSTNPLFVSSSDLHPRQPLLVAGTPVTGITTDYAGITRSTVPTIGAYELTQVVTTAATAVTQTGATLNGTVNACSQNVVTSFEYGLTTSYGSSVAATPSSVTGNTATGITAALTGLTINTLYHYRAVGTVGSAKYYGADMSFNLLPTCPEPTSVVATVIGQTSASIAWTPPASAPASGYDIYYSTSSTAPTTSTTPSGSVAAGVTAYTMTPLTMGTLYYVWVRSNCGGGYLGMWSTVYSFTTHGIVITVITVPGNYPTLTGVGGAFEAINAGGLNGNTTINITADLTEPGTYALNGWTENPSGSNYTLLIKPDASTLRTISGTLTWSTSTPALIRTNGASRFTIDGQAGKYLTFRNTTSTPAGTAGTVLFDNSSTSCYLKNSTLENNYNSTYYGTVTVGNTGSNSVEISGNDIRNATAGTIGIPAVGFYCASSTSSLNILNNNVYNFNSYGILMVTAANGAVISGNSVYYNSSTPPTGSQFGIYLMAATFNHLVSNNYVGGQAPLCQGNAWTYPGTTWAGIYSEGTNAGAITFSGNIIRNITMTSSSHSSFYGLKIGDGLFNIMNNTVGSESVAGSITYAGTGYFYGLYLVSSNEGNQVDNNIFGNWSLTAASGSPLVCGIFVSSMNASKNKIFNISVSNAALTADIRGILCQSIGTGTNVYSNNLISLDGGAGINSYIAGFSNGGNYSGMNFKFYYNDIHISGPTSLGSSIAFNFWTYNNLELKNNIFSNVRGQVGSNNFVLYFLNHGALISDYNDFYTVTGPFSKYNGGNQSNLAEWKAATGQDAHSLSTNPLYISSTDLHPQQPLLVAGTPVPVITTDYAGITRASVPTIGAYEMPQVTTTAATSVTQTAAVMNGTVNACAQNVVTSFEYGLTTAYGSSVAATPSPVTGTTSTSITAALSGLTPNTLYHYRAVGTVGTLKYYGADFTFDLVPTPSITSGPTVVCSGVPGNVYTTQSGKLNYVWTVVGGTVTAGGTSTSNTVTITWNTTGLQSVSVNYQNTSGISAPSPAVYGVTVNPLPAPTITGSAVFCAGSTGVIYATESGMTGYTWTLSAGGTITAGAGTNQITVTWNTAGAQNVNINYVNSYGCTATTPTANAVTVNTLPVPTITGAASVCAGTTGVTYSTEAAMTGYTWTVSAGGSITAGSGTNSITVTWNTPGAQNVYVNYVNSDGCTATTPTAKAVTVNLLPVPTITGSATFCAGSTGVIYATESGMTGYTWAVSAGGTITAGAGTSQITVTWSTAGAQNVYVNYVNSNGCTATTPTVKAVTVNPLPVPTITGSVTFCAGSTGVIYATESGMTGYTWTVSAGGAITAGAGTSQITVTWYTAGAQNVYVNYLNSDGCTATTPTAKAVTVYPLPAPTITGAASVCAGTTGVTYSTEAAMTGYTWTVSAGGSITAGSGTNSITVTWNTAGSQNVYVNYVNSNGCTAITPTAKAVTVNPLPGPTITGSAAVCAGSTGIIYVTESGMTGYTWAVSAGGTITAGADTDAITVTWNTAGSQNVSVNYLNANGCTAVTPSVKNVTVNPLPVPTITGSTSLCVNSGYYAYMTEASMYGYIWTISAGGTLVTGAGTNHISVIWNTPGAQSVSVTYTSLMACVPSSPTTLNVAVNPIPGDAGSITGATTVCGGAQDVTYSTPPIADAVTYVWTLPAGASIATGTGTNDITVNFATYASSGNISVFGNNLCGSGTTSSLQVAVTQLVAAAGIIAGQGDVCQGESGVVYTVAPIANATEYIWTIPPGTTIVGGAGTNFITVDFGMNAVSGVFTVYGSNSCGNGAVSSDFNVTVNPIPATPVVTAIGDMLTSSASSGNQWYFSATQGGTGIIIPGATSQSYQATQTGWYWTVVNAGGCESDPSLRVYIMMVGVDELRAESFNIFPVPNDGKFTVSIISTSKENFTITVINNLGVQICEIRDNQVNGRFDQVIDLRPVAPGIYMVVIRNCEQQILRKIIVGK